MGRITRQISQHRRQRAYPQGRVLRPHRLLRGVRDAGRVPDEDHRCGDTRGGQHAGVVTGTGGEHGELADAQGVPGDMGDPVGERATQWRRRSPRLLLQVEASRLHLRRDRLDLAGGVGPDVDPGDDDRGHRVGHVGADLDLAHGAERVLPAGGCANRRDEPGELEHRVGPVGEARGACVVAPAVQLHAPPPVRSDEPADAERGVDLLRGQREALLHVHLDERAHTAQSRVVLPDGVDVQPGLRRRLGVADAVVIDPGEDVRRVDLTGQEAAAGAGDAEARALLVDESDDADRAARGEDLKSPYSF